MMQLWLCLGFLQLTAVWAQFGFLMNSPPMSTDLVCLRLSPPRNCEERCSTDRPCAAGQVCCFNGCGHSCVSLLLSDPPGSPVGPPSMPSPVPSPSCPPLTGGPLGICVEMCSTDRPCAPNMLCCYNGCGHTCVPKYTAPPSLPSPSCPVMNGPAGSCAEDCGRFKPCAPGLLCCSNGCGHQCMSPVTEPGDSCSRTDCADNQVCEVIPIPCLIPPCPTRATCVTKPNPPPVIEDPCEVRNVRCNNGEVCRAKSVTCVQAPCLKEPECVPAVPGKCPRQPPINPLCRADAIDRCRYDRQCGAGELCCQDPCGKTECMKPEVLTNPCAATTCLASQECQVLTPMCITGLPCPPPKAVCVDVDPCATVDCAPGSVCVKGECVVEVDACATVLCAPGSVCVRGICIEICSLPKDSGPCEAAMPRFYNDPKTGYCKKFTFGGCAGNQNNFHTIGHCTGICGGKADPCDSHNCGRGEKCVMLATPCAPGTSPCELQPACQRDNPCATVRCRAGTQCVNGNCVAITPIDVCSLPKETGPCRASMPRFYYDPETGYCKKFIYGGCRGNQNNFNVVEDCTSKCGGKPDPCDTANCADDEECVLLNIPCELGAPSCDPQTVCQKNKKKDPCATVACATGTECLDGKCVDVCQLPMKRGTCIFTVPMFYFDSVTKTCKRFGYSGCDGNGNNFSTKEECGKRCGVNTDPCNGECDRGQRCLTLLDEKHVCVPTAKYGFCPNPFTGPSVCDFSECLHDYDCQTNHKCCVNECGSKQCTKPVYWLRGRN